MGTVQVVLYFAVLVALVRPLGAYMARVYEGEATRMMRVLGPVERSIYRVLCVDPAEEMDWKRYAVALLSFNLVGCVVLYLLQRVQGALPGNPQHLGAVSPDLAFNTAIVSSRTPIGRPIRGSRL
mgnify:CR=1 FL=1